MVERGGVSRRPDAVVVVVVVVLRLRRTQLLVGNLGEQQREEIADSLRIPPGMLGWVE